MNDTLLRALGPQGLTAERHEALKGRLLHAIGADGSQEAPIDTGEGSSRPQRDDQLETGPDRSPDPAAHLASVTDIRGYRPLRAVAFAAALAVVTTASAAAAVVTIVRPDPQEASTVMEIYADDVAHQGPGWRRVLQAEVADCVLDADHPNGRPDDNGRSNTFASDFPLGDPITAADYRRACERKMVEAGPVPIDEKPTMCRRRGLFPQPVVVLDGSSCGSVKGFLDYGPVDSSPELIPLTGSDLRVLNDARRIEVGLFAIRTECPTRVEVEAWVRARLAREDVDLIIGYGPATSSTTARRPPLVACFGVFADWMGGVVDVLEVGWSE